MADLPAVDRLGYAINLVDITPFDIGAVDDYVIYRRRLLTIDFSSVREVEVNGKKYSVPVDVSVTSDNQPVRGEYITYRTGSDAANQFNADASYPLRYFAVSGTTSGAFAARKSFLSTHQYAFFSYTEGSYSARLRDYGESLNEGPLVTALTGVPPSFDSSDAVGVGKYKEFFRDHGSHVIINAGYGARYPLKVWASNESADVNQMFNTDVNVKFNGIPSGGVYDASVKNQNQYKRFSEYFQYLVTVSGGGDRSKLANTDGTYADYTTWIASIQKHDPGLLNFQVIELWSLMKYAQEPLLRLYSTPLYDAFMWIVGHPDVYKTAVSLDIQSDWAGFDLLTPSAVIIPDPANPYPSSNMIASNTRLQWGKEGSFEYERLVLRFFVINDGSPLDFSTSHGSHTAGIPNGGKAIATFVNLNYTNDRVTDNSWNTKWFFKAPVNGTPLPGRLNRVNKPYYSWDEVLQDYLSTIE